MGLEVTHCQGSHWCVYQSTLPVFFLSTRRKQTMDEDSSRTRKIIETWESIHTFCVCNELAISQALPAINSTPLSTLSQQMFFGEFSFWWAKNLRNRGLQAVEMEGRYEEVIALFTVAQNRPTKRHLFTIKGGRTTICAEFFYNDMLISPLLQPWQPMETRVRTKQTPLMRAYSYGISNQHHSPFRSPSIKIWRTSRPSNGTRSFPCRRAVSKEYYHLSSIWATTKKSRSFCGRRSAYLKHEFLQRRYRFVKS